MKTHFDSLKCLLLLSIFTLGGWSGTSIADKVTLDSGGHKLKGTLCRTGGTGPSLPWSTIMVVGVMPLVDRPRTLAVLWPKPDSSACL
jgi:hypothetical protein